MESNEQAPQCMILISVMGTDDKNPFSEYSLITLVNA